MLVIAVAHARRGRDQVDVEFALQPLLNDFEVQQPEKAAAEAEAQRDRIFRLEIERAVVQPQFFERIAQQPVLVRLDRVEAGEHHRLDFLEAGQRLRSPGWSSSVIVSPILASATFLMLANRKPASPAVSSSQRNRLGRLVRRGLPLRWTRAVRPQANLLALAQRAVDDAGEDDHAAIGIEPGIEDQRAQRCVGIAFGRRHALDDRFENFLDADAVLGAGQHGVAAVQPDHLFDLLANPLGFGGRQVDLVDDRDDLEIVVESEIGIGERLRFNALRRVDHQQRAFARLQAARDFVGEIDVPGRIDEIELIRVGRRRPCNPGERRGL